MALSFEDILDPNRELPARRTKLIATVGPTSREYETLVKLIEAGVNVFRLNFSHGTHEEHTENIERIRKAAKETDSYVAVLQDLSGPKMRISEVDEDRAELVDGSDVRIRCDKDTLSNGYSIYTESVNPVEVLAVGHKVLLADGTMVLETTSIGKQEVVCKVIKGGNLRSRVGIAFPDSDIDLPATTEKDLHDLDWGVKHKVDYCALSFVKNAADVVDLRNQIKKRKSDIRIVSKIEQKSALLDIENILEASDGVMIARGDLGVNIPMERLPVLQKMLVERANSKGIPVIVATQMLQSMVKAVRPTRAEVADVSLAVLNGADAVMLSEETAIGQFPIESVKYLHHIAQEAERRFEFHDNSFNTKELDLHRVSDAIAFSACAAAQKVNAEVVIACTETGTSARLVSKYRPRQPLYGVSSREETLTRMCLYWGVIPISCSSTKTHSDEIITAMKEVQNREHLPNGSKAVVTGGLSARNPGTTSIMEIRDMSFL